MLHIKRNLLSSNRGEKRDPKMKISVISDQHVVAIADRDEDFPPIGNRLLWTPLTKMQKFVDYTNGLNANDKPSVILNLGDVINGDAPDPNFQDSFDAYNHVWNQLDSSIPKKTSAGNHDYTNIIPNEVDGMTKHEYVATQLGYGSHPYVAGSKMQESFSVTSDGFPVRFLNLETNKSPDDNFSINGGYFFQPTLDWLHNEMVNAEEDLVVIFGHRFRPHMPEEEALKFEYVIQNVNIARPDLNIVFLYGHSHVPHTIKTLPRIGDYQSYNLSAIVDNLTAYSADFYLDEKGVVYFDELTWKYT